jgi:hypothetical protein
MSAQTPSFHAPKSDRPLRTGICVTVGKVFGDGRTTEERVVGVVTKGGMGEDKGTTGGESEYKL